MYDTPDSSDLAEKDNSFKRKKQPTKCQPSTTLLVKKFENFCCCCMIIVIFRITEKPEQEQLGMT